MTREEINANFAINIEKERLHLGYTQSQMAKALEMSLSSYKNMISGVSVNIPIYVAHLAYELTGKLLFELHDEVSPALQALIKFRDLPPQRREAIETMVLIECQLSDYIHSHDEKEPSCADENDLITVYIANGNMEDGMILDSVNIETVNIRHYRRLFGDRIDCGIKITSNHLHPAYHRNDILLISHKPPRDGDTGIFINKVTQRIYIRKYRETQPNRLEPIVGYGKPIIIDTINPKELENWIKFGCVITKMR